MHLDNWSVTDAGEPSDPQPEIQILSPPNATSVTAGAKLVLEAEADEGTPPLTVEWFEGTTSPEDKIGEGESIEWDTTGLSEGQYTIIARVTDDLDYTASDSIQVGIGETVTVTTRREALKLMARIALREPDAAKRTIPIFISNAQGQGVTGITSGLRIKKRGGGFGNATGTLTARGDAGWYDYECVASNVDTSGPAVLMYAQGGNWGATYFEVVAEPSTIQTTVTSATSQEALTIPSGLGIRPGSMVYAIDGPAAGSMAVVGTYTGTTLLLKAPGLAAQPSGGNGLLFYAGPAIEQAGGATPAQIRTELDNNSTRLAAIQTATDRIPIEPAAKDDVPTAVQVRTELDNNSTRLAAIQTSTDRVTATRAGNLDRLDVAVSSRLAASAYTAPDNAGVSTLVARLTASRASLLDNLNRLDVAVSSVAGDSPGVGTLLTRLSAVRAGLLDNLSRLDMKISDVQLGGGGATPQQIREEIDSNSTQLAALIARLTPGRADLLDNLSRLDVSVSSVASGGVPAEVIAEAVRIEMDARSQRLALLADAIAEIPTDPARVSDIPQDLTALMAATVIDGVNLLKIFANVARALLGDREGTGTTMETFRALDGSGGAKALRFAIDENQDRTVTFGEV